MSNRLVYPGRSAGFRCRRTRESFALVLTLIFVALLAAIVLIFFGQAELWRKISLSSAAENRADILANTALDTIKGDLMEEIRAGSTAKTMGTTTIYLPTTNFMLVPQRTTSGTMTNLISESQAGIPLWQTTNNVTYAFNGPIRSAANNSTATAARNGRIISLSSWLKPDLLNATEGGNLQAPDWVVVSRNGPYAATNIPSMAVLSNRSTSNGSYAIGRYAYTIYDESGLIDINSGGYPSTGAGLTAAQAGRKGLLAFADLTQIPNGSSGNLTQSQVDALVSWRNAASKPTYYNCLTNFASTNGFMRVTPGDQPFIGRQDLVNYAQVNGLTNSLPYLTTFTREYNSPNGSPRYNASDLGGNNNGTTYAYRDQAEVPGAVNPDLANVRASDGTLLLKTRFPLSRIGLLAAGTDAADIMTYFGLSGSATAGWTYGHGAAQTGILTLDQVKSQNRSPDFFELLKAAILNGSLGLSPGIPAASQVGPASAPTLFASGDNSTAVLQDAQIIQIGANIIDQFDADSYPTTIIFDGPKEAAARTFYGIENLPYLTRAITFAYNPTSTNSPPPASTKMETWLVPELWSPYQDSGTAVAAPAYVRVQATGSCYTYWANSSESAIGNTVNFDAIAAAPGANLGNQGSVNVSAAQIPMGHPAMLSSTYNGASATYVENTTGWTPYRQEGIYTGYATMPNPPPSGIVWVTWTPTPLNLLLQWSNDGSNWTTYSRMENLTTGFSAQYPSYQGSSTLGVQPFYARVDPRTDRFGTSENYLANSYFPNLSIRTTAANGSALTANLPNTPQFTVGPGTLGTFADNTSISPSSYTDVDGVRRRAAGAYAPGSGTDGYPLIPTTAPVNPVLGLNYFSVSLNPSKQTDTLAQRQDGRRPVMLNRPFQSVGELGYTFRDEPFKELDFFTHESADGALLDIFSAYDEPSVVAGRVSLNTPHREVLQSLLSGSICQEYTPATTLSAEVPAIANALVNRTSDLNPADGKGPLACRSDLVTEFSDDLTPCLTVSADQVDKTRRESVVRALADVSNTRTWNLMIDVIAQAGEYPPGAANLNDFVVQGERRYWLHVAIDRYTGKVIDELYEPVNE